MAIHLEKISSTVDAYLARHPDEVAALRPLTEALDKGFDFTSRRRFPAHITAGVLLTDAHHRVLQIHHRSLGAWLTPGGHCEPDDKSLVETALRELALECGIDAEDIEAPDPDESADGHDPLPARIEVHSIPPHQSRDEPAHRHFHFGYRYRLVNPTPVRIGGEAGAYRWHPLDPVADRSADRRTERLPATT